MSVNRGIEESVESCSLAWYRLAQDRQSTQIWGGEGRDRKSQLNSSGKTDVRGESKGIKMRCDSYMMKMHKSVYAFKHSRCIEKKITLVPCTHSDITYSSGFVISTSAIAQGELRALTHYDFIYQPMSYQDLVSQINTPNKDRKHTHSASIKPQMEPRQSWYNSAC